MLSPLNDRRLFQKSSSYSDLCQKNFEHWISARSKDWKTPSTLLSRLYFPFPTPSFLPYPSIYPTPLHPTPVHNHLHGHSLLNTYYPNSNWKKTERNLIFSTFPSAIDLPGIDSKNIDVSGSNPHDRHQSLHLERDTNTESLVSEQLLCPSEEDVKEEELRALEQEK